MKYTPLIVTLVLILIIIGIIYTAYRRIKRKVKSSLYQLFGTSDIRKANQMMQQEVSSTPKSVSAMTSLYLPKITKDFPDFSYNEMKDRANNAVTSYLMAIDSLNPSLLREGTSDLKNKLTNYVEMLKASGKNEHFEDILIHRTEISQYRRLAGRCIITFQTALLCMHYVTDDSGKVTNGSADMIYQTKYNTDLLYIQDRNLINETSDNGLGLNCPNCGAPIRSLGDKCCEYCGTSVVAFNIKTWDFNNIEGA